MSSIKKYDAIVVGTGQGGKPLAIALAKAGKKTAIIEQGDVGGTCVNVGCTPTKTMVACARVAYLARRGADFGVQTDVKIDLKKVRDVKRRVVTSFREGSERGIESTANLELIRGHASFLNEHELAVSLKEGSETATLRADQLFLNAGSKPRVINFEGLDNIDYLNSEHMTEFTEAPQHLIIIGGGYIGIEFAQMYSRFGSQVTIVARDDLLDGREDPDVTSELRRILEEDGVRIFTHTETKQVARQGDALELSIEGKGGTIKIQGSHLLTAAGRVPNTEGLNCEAAGVALDSHGHIQVNEKLETSVPNIWALGDVVGGPAFTHIAYDDYRIIETNLLKGGGRSTKDRLVPYCLFTDPELGRVGLTEQQARKQGYNIKVAKLPMSYVARAIEMSETRGLMKAIVDSDTHQILGCAILGVMGGELMAILQMAMLAKIPYTVLRDNIFAHPTMSEAFNNLFTTIESKNISID